MALRLPDFRARKCVEIDFCGFAPEEGDDSGQPPAITKSLVARYPGADQEITFGLITPFPRDGSRLHIHLRFLVGELAGKKSPPVNSTPEGILALLQNMEGDAVRVNVKGGFRLARNDFPSFIRTTSVETVTDKIEVRMVGGTLAVRGAPIHTIGWRMIDKGQNAEVTLEARTDLTLDESYFESGLDLLESALNAFILRERSNG